MLLILGTMKVIDLIIAEYVAFIKPGEVHKRIKGDIILWKRIMTE